MLPWKELYSEMYIGNKVSHIISYVVLKYGTAVCASFVLIFICAESLHGDASTVQAGIHGDTTAYAVALGLDKPWYTRFVVLCKDIVMGGGMSLAYHTPVLDIIVQKLYITAPLALFGFLASVGIGISMGVCTHVYRGYVLPVCIVLGIAIPVVWLGIFAIYMGAVVLGIFPFGGVDTVGAYVLPVLVIGVSQGMITAHYTRIALVTVANKDYMFLAELRGLGKFRKVLYHGIPAISGTLWALFGLQMGFLITGVVVLERVFSISGVGDLLFQAVVMRDTPVLVMLVSLLCVLVIVINAISDLGAYITNPTLRKGYQNV